MRFTIPFLLFSALKLSAQIPEGYYDETLGLSGVDLKLKLNEIIKDHQSYPYSSSSTDTWDILKESDRDPANQANVILFYTGWSVNAAQEYNNGNGWNREHVWAKSHGDFGTAQGPGTDLHHIRPADISVNTARDSRWFDYCSEPYFDNGLETGCFRSTTKYTFQPRQEVMGDVARMIFYMATRYEGESGEPDLEVIDYLPADDYTSDPVHALLTTLLEWNEADPVDDFERNRNEVVFNYQHNRNPYIDHPEFVNLIYRESTRLEEEKSINEIVIYPNPSQDFISISCTKSNELKTIIDLQSRVLIETLDNRIDISSLEKGFYFIRWDSEKGRVICLPFIKE